MTMTIQKLAFEASSYFEGAKRPDGTDYRRLKKERPEWVHDQSGGDSGEEDEE